MELSMKAKRLRYQIKVMRNCIKGLDVTIEKGEGKIGPWVQYRESVKKNLAKAEGLFAVETGTAVSGMHYNELMRGYETDTEKRLGEETTYVGDSVQYQEALQEAERMP